MGCSAEYEMLSMANLTPYTTFRRTRKNFFQKNYDPITTPWKGRSTGDGNSLFAMGAFGW